MNCQRWLTIRKKSGEFMAKNKIEQVHMEQPEKKSGFFQKLFYYFLIPVVFCIAVLLVITLLSEKNVFEYIEELPFFSSNDDQQLLDSSGETKQKIVSLQAELQEKEAEIAKVQSQFDSATVENHQLQVEIERLQYEIEKLKISQEESTKEFKDILSTFEKMSAKKAAPIIVQMNETEAVRILSNMKPDTLTAIFEKMSPQDAAKYTQLLTNE
jgi:flagellar protein FlbB